MVVDPLPRLVGTPGAARPALGSAPAASEEDGDPVLALDVGGTKLAAGLVATDGTLLTSERVPTPRSRDPEEVWSAVESLLARVRAGRSISGVGVGCGGPMRWPQGEVSPLNIPAWRSFPLRERVAAACPDLRVVVHNDAVAFALAEARCGAGRRASAVLGVVVSTGVGGGIVLDGRPLDGPTGQAGHVGHLVAEPDGPLCSCGARGCLEAVARGPALVAAAQEGGWRPSEGREATGTALAVSAADGDPVAIAALARGGRALGRVLAGVAAVLDLDVVVLGGGIASAGEALWQPLQETFAESARLSFVQRCLVVPSALGSAAGLVGAASLLSR